jgi:hypothetical protein
VASARKDFEGACRRAQPHPAAHMAEAVAAQLEKDAFDAEAVAAAEDAPVEAAATAAAKREAAGVAAGEAAAKRAKADAISKKLSARGHTSAAESRTSAVAKAAKEAKAAAKAAEAAAEAAAMNSFSDDPSANQDALRVLKPASLRALLEKRRPPTWSDMLWQCHISCGTGPLQKKVRQAYGL